MFSLQNDDLSWYGCLATQHYLGWKGFRLLMQGAGSAESVYSLSEAGLREIYPKIHPGMVESLLKGPDFRAWDSIKADCGRLGITIWIPGREGYPQFLMDLEAPPPLLYAQGEWRTEDARAVAMVGTRSPTQYGVDAARALTRGLCEAGYTIVSGLALGVDTEAHQAALEAPGGRTLAVVGSGLDVVYPPENAALQARIPDRGAVISEFPPGTSPLRRNFPLRNRLLSSLSQATVVVEAGEGSGALITAQEARRQKKIVFATPGSMFNTKALGNQILLRQGALLAASVDDIVAALEGVDQVLRNHARQQAKLPPRESVVKPKPAAKSGSRSKAVHAGVVARVESEIVDTGPIDPVLRLWSGDETCGLDSLSARAIDAGLWPADRAAAALIESLLQLEMRGAIQRLPGPSYRRKP